MATKTELKVPTVVHGTRPPSDTAQTPGMERRPAIDAAAVGASKIWFGTVTSEPNHKGPPHQHGEAETAAYVISGHVRVHYGENFEESVEAGPGELPLRARTPLAHRGEPLRRAVGAVPRPAAPTTSSSTWSSRDAAPRLHPATDAGLW